MNSKYEILKSVFGYDTFREGQEAIIDSILSGRDVLGIMPTGAGKSLCYQVPALMFQGITVVVSPLISLMADQVRALNEAGVHAAYINSSLTEVQIGKAMENARHGRYKIIYVAPERLTTLSFLSLAEHVEIDLIAVDEAHCISQWGQNFRPGYLKIVDFIEKIPRRPIIAAFTATATQAVKQDITCILGLEEPFVTVTGYDRRNLFFAVEKPQNKMTLLKAYLKDNPGRSGIIYCNTRKMVEEVYDKLSEEGFPVARYHAGLSDGERKDSQEKFIYDELPLMVATNAFGMGIDKSNVRFVIHYNMPKDMESYYQEAGRAGRDGLESECILYYAGQDVRTNEYLIGQQSGPEELSEEDRRAVKEREYERLRKMTFYCFTHECLRDYILKYFGEYGSAYCGKCSNCLTEFEETDITEDAAVLFRLIKTTGGRYGISAIVDAAHGNDNEKIRKYRLSQNPYYGLLGRTSAVIIRQIVNELLLRDFLALTADEYPVLKLSAKAEDWLEYFDGSERIVLKLPKKRENTGAGRKALRGKAADGVLYPDLFEKLRALRLELAKREHMPPYIIFTDKTLNEMSTYLPDTRDKMLQISGVGINKYQKYGAEFERIIREYKSAHEDSGEERKVADSEQEKGAFANYKESLMQKGLVQVYSAWSQQEDSQLSEEFAAGLKVKEMSEIHKRTPGAIRSRLKKLGLQE